MSTETQTTTILTSDDQTIVAQCTPTGSGALALIRISGNDAVTIASVIASLGSKKLIDQLSHTIHAGWVVNPVTKERIDQVLFLLMRAPKTFTGQDTVEITCHNNPFICERIIELAIAHGARLAQEGEFTRRAYLNNKIDLVQAEAINDLIHANTASALKASLAQIEGSFTYWIAQLEQSLITLLAFSEASFEFVEDELPLGAQMNSQLDTILEKVRAVKATYSLQNHIRQGIRIAIIGCVNAGKSSLFNTILNRTRAIVTPIPGTTRDVIEAGLYMQGNYWTLIDTAGLRATEDVIEQEGIRRAHEEAKMADIILLVFDSSRQLSDAERASYEGLLRQYPEKTIVVGNKCDTPAVQQALLRASESKPSAICLVSTQTKQGIPELMGKIEARIVDLLAQAQSPYLLNQRQHNLLLGLEKRLSGIKNMLSGEIAYELVSYELRDAIACLSELTGRSISEASLDQVFRSFCVGK